MKNEQKWVAAFAALCLIPRALLASLPIYTLAPLDGLIPPEPFGWVGEAQGLNNQGQVVGKAASTGGDHAVLWTNGQIQDLGLGKALDINDSGTVIGQLDQESFLWDAVLGRRPITIPGYQRVFAFAISDAGQIAGTVFNFSPSVEWAFLYEADGSYSLLAPPGAVSSNANCISPNGHVAGTWTDTSGTKRMYLFRDGAVTDLGRPPSGYTLLDVNGVNRHDVLAISAFRLSSSTYVCLKYDFPHGSWIQLPSPGSYAQAYDINDVGQVLGYVGEPALWDAQGTFHYVRDIVDSMAEWNNLNEVRGGLNDLGAICGGGYDRNVTYRPWLATPVVCPGNIIADAWVDLLDLSAFLSSFASCNGEINFEPAADLDADGCVDLDDLGLLLANFGTSCL